MRLYFKDTELSYREISELLNSHIGDSGPETWHNGAEKKPFYCGYVEIYDDTAPGLSFVVLKW